VNGTERPLQDLNAFVGFVEAAYFLGGQLFDLLIFV